jgi:bifunctional non-homologous end joining protein LigD
MLARSGPLPTGKGWRYELKCDGFRALICTHGGRLRVRSRRGWDMTARIPELAECLPADVQLDGELVAWGDDAQPDFHRLARRMLHGDASIPVTLMAFDVLAVNGEPILRLPYTERRALLDEVLLGDANGVEVVESFEDGLALWDAVVERGLEGVVAKREREPYRPGARLWVKTKNQTTVRFQEELAAATRLTRRRAFGRRDTASDRPA